jgi:hypothetical protein
MGVPYRTDLETPRFLLRPLVAEDVDSIGDLSIDPEVDRFLGEGADSAVEARRIAEGIPPASTAGPIGKASAVVGAFGRDCAQLRCAACVMGCGIATEAAGRDSCNTLLRITGWTGLWP